MVVNDSDLLKQLQSILSKIELSLGVINESIIWLDQKRQIVWCNSVFDNLLQRPRIQIIGKNIDELLPLKRHDDKTSRTDCGVYEYTETEKNCFLEIYSKPVSFAEDIAVVVVIRDITDQYYRQMQL